MEPCVDIFNERFTVQTHSSPKNAFWGATQATDIDIYHHMYVVYIVRLILNSPKRKAAQSGHEMSSRHILYNTVQYWVDLNC